ncbi:MAG: class I SAM-dependent methyltransferase [Oscillospiraceae bacterium]|nr:class I SAM-dependent methyltransferase [Oscillospiraceae bacterium]
MKSFWDRMAGIYDLYELVNRRVNRQIEEITAENIRKGDIVLDCAAGTGMLTFAAARNAKCVLCTDLSREMLIIAKKKARSRGVFNVKFALRDIFALKDRDGCFDRVMAGNVLHLLPDSDKAAKELIRVTKKGGKILLPTYVSEDNIVSRIAVGVIKIFGFDPSREYSFETYRAFIERIVGENGCEGYEIILAKGLVPAAYAIITK